MPIAVSHVGVAVPPRVGDLVLVEFLDHDIQQPLVTGRFYHDQERAPLFKQDEVLFEHRLPDGTFNHLRFAADGSIFLQRDVKKREDNSEFLAGMRIDPEGLIEFKTSDDVVVTLDQKNGKIAVLCKDKPIEITCDKLTVDADMQVKKNLTVDNAPRGRRLNGTIKGTGKISSVTISGTDITGGCVMADLNLKGPLNLMGNLTLKGGQGEVNGVEALVEVTPSDPAQCSAAPPVIIPPPPAAPLQPQPTVWIVNSFNKTVKAGTEVHRRARHGDAGAVGRADVARNGACRAPPIPRSRSITSRSTS